MNSEQKKVRGYAGWKLVQNTVLDYLPDNATETTHTAREIALEQNLNCSSVRIASKRLGIKLKPDKRGGLRIKGVKRIINLPTNNG